MFLGHVFDVGRKTVRNVETKNTLLHRKIVGVADFLLHLLFFLLGDVFVLGVHVDDGVDVEEFGVHFGEGSFVIFLSELIFFFSNFFFSNFFFSNFFFCVKFFFF